MKHFLTQASKILTCVLGFWHHKQPNIRSFIIPKLWTNSFATGILPTTHATYSPYKTSNGGVIKVLFNLNPACPSTHKFLRRIYTVHRYLRPKTDETEVCWSYAIADVRPQCHRPEILHRVYHLPYLYGEPDWGYIEFVLLHEYSLFELTLALQKFIPLFET
jgi:hypothetical protein